MIRVKISNFIKNNINKIRDLGIKLIIVAIIIIIATIILSTNRNHKTNSDNYEKESYKPTETIIQGASVKKEQYEKDNNIINKFLEYCNNKDISKAYELLSMDCKKELYPTIEDFKKYYYETIFDKERTYNLQAWISDKKYTVYKIRYTNNMLSTGLYNEDDVYQDYITLNKKSNKEEIFIGNLVYCEELNIITKTKEIEAIVIKKKVYVSDEEYEIKIKNNTDKIILMDTLQNNKNIRLLTNDKTEYGAYTNSIFMKDLLVEPWQTGTISIKFKKNLSSDKKSKVIQFSNIIKDYITYKENSQNYNDVISIQINVED